MPTMARSRRLHAAIVNTIVAHKLQKASLAPDVGLESLLEVTAGQR